MIFTLMNNSRITLVSNFVSILMYGLLYHIFDIMVIDFNWRCFMKYDVRMSCGHKDTVELFGKLRHIITFLCSS